MSTRRSILPRWVIPVSLCVALGAAFYFALTPGLRAARAMLPLLVRVNTLWAGGAALCQVCVYVCVAGILRAGLAKDHRPGFGALVPMGGAFLWANRALPGPAVAGLATLVFLLGRRRVPAAAAQAAAAVFYVADYVAFFVMGAGLAIAIAAGGRLASLHPAVLSVAVGLIVVGMVAAAVILRSPAAMERVAVSLARTMARIRRAAASGEAATGRAASEAVGGFYARWQNVTERPGALLSACCWAMAMHAFEAATLMCAVIAFNVEGRGITAVSLPVAAGAAYIAANLAAIISFLPAGLGFFEGAMGTALHLLGGATVPQAALATVMYRLLSVWLPLPLVAGTARLALATAGRAVTPDTRNVS